MNSVFLPVLFLYTQYVNMHFIIELRTYVNFHAVICFFFQLYKSILISINIIKNNSLVALWV